MNQKILEIQVEELMVFFEKHPTQTKTFNVAGYKKLIKGLIGLIQKLPESIDLTDISALLEIEKSGVKNQFIEKLKEKIKKCKEPVTLDYIAILKILKCYFFCLNNQFKVSVTNEEWLELAGSTRDLEMERLWYNVKK